jgi:nuclear pore complex protein Nup160
VAARALPVTSPARAVTPAPAHAVATSQKAHVLLEGEAQNLIRLFVQDHESFAMVFIPTPSSTTSGGFFHLFSTRDDQLVSVASLECSLRTVHCHLQDFSIVGGTLYALWDTQGRASVERIKLALTSSNRRARVMTAESAIWDTAAYAAEPELTPAYLDQLLLQPGSLTGTLMTAILKPGSFSPLTLRLALEQYTNALLSLPGDIPLALRTSYATVAENIAAVVGCRVVLSRNPQTGAAEHDKYWQALRRDWEGFIARCRELERSARWPVAIAVVDQFQPSTAVTARSQNGTASSSPDVFLEDSMFRDILVIERERVGVVALEDLALQLHRILTESSAVPQPFALMDGVWKLRSQLGPTIMTDIESRLIDLSRQEIAFPLPDIIQHQVQQVRFLESLDEGFTAWFQGRMDNIDLTGANIRIALDLIGGFEQAVVKMEIRTEGQSEAGAESQPPEWQRALAVSYCTATVEARYELAVSLVILLFFYAHDLTTWDPNLIAEIFAVFRGLAMLRYIVRQPAAATGSSNSDRLNTDDIAARMRDMSFARQTDETTGHAYSLLHQLMAQHGGLARTSSIHTAHRYLNEAGILQSSSPAQATRPEAVFCKTLWEQGYLQVARELLTWLPRTPAVTYVLGLLWIDMGRADDAGPLLERLGGMFGEGLQPRSSLPS